MLKKLRKIVREAAHRYSFFGKVLEVAETRRHAFNERFEAARKATQKAKEELDFLHDHKGISPQKIEDATQVLFGAEHRERAMLRKREFWRDRYVWARERHHHWGSVLRHRKDRLRRWIRQHRTFQPYMANGNPYEKLTAEAKHAIYLDFRDGLYVTSTYEGFPGDGVHSTSSGHYLQNQPDDRARCWDSGAISREAMVKAQTREARRAPEYLTEMFGPDNTFNYKNGVRFTLGEGEALETMHDNHKHTWLRDGAPVA